MPTEDPQATAALAGIQSSALAIYDQRRRLNEAFEALQRAANLIDPNVQLLGNGTLKYNDATGPESVVQPPTEPRQAPLGDAAAGIHPQPTPPEPAPKPAPSKPVLTSKTQQRLAKIETLLESGQRYTIGNIATATNEPSEAVRYLVNKMISDGKVIRIDAKPLPMFMRAAPVTSRPLPPESEEEVTTNNGLADRVDAENARASTPLTPPVAESNGAATSYGLARSPKPRSDMKAQQRESEDRKDRLVRWFLDQDRPRNAADVEKEFGVPMSTLGKDLRDLLDRGVLVRTGYGHPEYKAGWPQEKLGRTSPIYKPAEGIVDDAGTREAVTPKS